MPDDIIIDQLFILLHDEEIIKKLRPVISRLEKTLSENNEPQAWQPIDLSTLGPGVPPFIKSAWLFVLRAGAFFGAEKHPNSHQRSFALGGSAYFEIFENNQWTEKPVSSTGELLENKAISIPPGTWHRIRIGAENFISLSFHTVPAGELIEETPVEDDLSVTQQRLYHG